MRRFFLIDICGTLYKSNTTFDFVKYHFADKRRCKVITLLRSSRAICKLNYLFFKLTGLDFLRAELIKLLKGYTKEELNKLVEDFYEEYLLPRKNRQCFEVINEYRKQGSRLILVSATLDIIAAEVAKRENVSEWIASELIFDNKKCKGKLGTDLLKGKLKTTLEMVNGHSFDVITDNYGDADIIAKSKHAYLVQYCDKRDKWSHFLNQEVLKKCEYIHI